MSKRPPIFGDQTVQLPSSPLANITNRPVLAHTLTKPVAQSDNPTRITTDYVFQEQTTPKIACFYHPEFLVKNFCSNSECLMPLCPACIQLHQTEHQTMASSAQFELLEKCLTRVYHNLAIKANSFVEDLSILDQFVNSIANTPQTLKEKLADAKAKCYKVVDAYFETLEKDISAVQNTEEIRQEAAKIQQGIARQWQGVLQLLQKLNSEKCLRTLIKCSSRDFLNEAQQSSIVVSQFVSQNQSSMQDLNVDQSQLYQVSLMLSRFVNFKNAQQLAVSPPRVAQDTQIVYTSPAKQFNNTYQWATPPGGQMITTTTAKQPQRIIAQQPQQIYTASKPQIIQTTTQQPQIITTTQPQIVTTNQPQVITTTQPQVITSSQPQMISQAQIYQTSQPQMVTSPQVYTTSQPQVYTTQQQQQQLTYATKAVYPQQQQSYYPQVQYQQQQPIRFGQQQSTGYNMLPIGTGQGQVIDLHSLRSNNQAQLPLLNYNSPVYQRYGPSRFSPDRRYSPESINFSPKINMS